MSAIFIPFSKLCWALGLSVSWLGDLCLALRLSVICGTYVWLWVCLFVGWATYVGYWVCLFCWLGDLCLEMVGLFYFEQAHLINCFWNIW